jgi:hypothetical protein
VGGPGPGKSRDKPQDTSLATKTSFEERDFFGAAWHKLVQVKFRLPPEAYDSEPPPILGSWRNVYIVVLAWLALLIALFYLFTRYFA